MSQEEYHPVPQPDEVSKREKDDAMGSYLMMFAAWGAGLPLPMLNVLAAIIYYYVNRKKGRFVVFHSYQSLWSQIIVGVLNASIVYVLFHSAIAGSSIFFEESGYLKHFLAYIAVVVLINLAYIVFSIIAAVKASKGQFFYFWFFGKLAYRKAYLITENDVTAPVVNKPPGK